VKSLSDVQNFKHAFPLEDWPERDMLVWNESLALGFNNADPRFWAAYWENIYLAGPLGVTGALKDHSLDAHPPPQNSALTSLPSLDRQS
jgi:amidase